MIDVSYLCPIVGKISYHIDEQTVVDLCWPAIATAIMADEVTMVALYEAIKAKLEEDFVLTPKY